MNQAYYELTIKRLTATRGDLGLFFTPTKHGAEKLPLDLIYDFYIGPVEEETASRLLNYGLASRPTYKKGLKVGAKLILRKGRTHSIRAYFPDRSLTVVLGDISQDRLEKLTKATTFFSDSRPLFDQVYTPEDAQDLQDFNPAKLPDARFYLIEARTGWWKLAFALDEETARSREQWGMIEAAYVDPIAKRFNAILVPRKLSLVQKLNQLQPMSDNSYVLPEEVLKEIYAALPDSALESKPE